MEKFPDHIDAPTMGNGGAVVSHYGYPNGGAAAPGFAPSAPRSPASRRENGAAPPPGSSWSSSEAGRSHGRGRGHGRQQSIGDAWRNIRTRGRNGSVSEHAHEIADALRAPVSPKLIALCLMWYTSSALTNTSSKSILNALDMPATLTLIQFAFVSSLCLILSWLASLYPALRTHVTALQHPIRKPTREVIATTMPLAAFQIGGHLLSSTATARIPVSLVHTIKGLSPLFTVLAYRFIYDIRYPKATYLSLVPLTLGVMLACSGKSGMGGQFLGVLQALMATLIFVTQNIFSKKLFNEAAKVEAEGAHVQSKKLDKLNLLCYSSGMAFIITMPIWFWTEGISLLGDFLWDGSVDLSANPTSMDHGRLALEFVFNGIFHFGQNILAFILLSMVSPVTYSVASLIKRVFVIVLAIIWFRSPTTPIQGVGIGLTFLGLYLYDRTSTSNKADRKVRAMADSGRNTPLLPQHQTLDTIHSQRTTPLPGAPQAAGHSYFEGYFGQSTAGDDHKKNDDAGLSRSNPSWLPPGTKQEDTWRSTDRPLGVA